jgi:predicted lipoprotein with Yx(FWY)xxD motif
MRRFLLVGLVLALAGCGGSGSKSSATGSTVKLASSKLGRILVDGKGRTLYLFAADTNGTSTCSGACAATWPPLTAASASAGDGLDGGALGTTKRADGTQQVTITGTPSTATRATGLREARKERTSTRSAEPGTS